MELITTAEADTNEDTDLHTDDSKLSLKIIAHNSRSLNQVNLHATAAMLEIEKPKIFLASEIWNSKEHI